MKFRCGVGWGKHCIMTFSGFEFAAIIKMAKEGKTIIVVSSEMPEILGITNRIGVMSNGRLSGIVNTKETNQEELLRLSAKYL